MGAVTYLLDTHTLLWWLFGAPQLSKRSRALIADRANTILVSSASVWEIATKHRLGRLPDAAALLDDASGWIAKAGFVELPISVAHAQRAGAFDGEHRDPFDRMIAAQSLVGGVPVIGKDAAIDAFGAARVW